MKIKELYRLHKKRFIIIIVSVILAAVLTGSYFTAYAIVFDKKCKMGEELVRGSVDIYEWASSDIFDADAYPSVTVTDGKLKVLALTDTHLEVTGLYAQSHWVKNAMVKKAYKHMDTLIKTSSPDFIVVLGDILTDPLSDIVMEDFRDFIDAYGIPWTVVFGNHDAEWRADKAKLCNIIQEAKNTVFQTGPTNLQGLGNSIVNFRDGEGKIFYSMITMDTGDWQKIDDVKKFFNNMRLDKTDREYSTENVGFTDEQADWYRWVVEGLKEYNGGETVETMLAYHIPIKANSYALSLSSDFGYNPGFENGEAVDYYLTPEQFEQASTKAEIQAAYDDYAENYEFMKAVLELGSTKAMISGHIHSDGYSVNFDGITYVSVVKTTDIYTSYSWDKGRRGGTYFELSVTPENGSHLTENKPWYYKEVA